LLHDAMSPVMMAVSISYSVSVFKKVCIKHDPFDNFEAADDDETAHMNSEEKKYFYVLLITTLLTIVCYTASMVIITVLDFVTPNSDEANVHLTIFACLTAVRFAASLYLVAKECLYLVFILRLHVIYGETYFKYRPKLLIFLAVGTLLFTVALLVLTQLTMIAEIVYSDSPPSLVNEFNAISCDIAIPDYLLLLFVVFDTITSSVLSYLFIRPLKATFNATVHDKEMRDKIKNNPHHLGRLRDLATDRIHSMNAARHSMSHSVRRRLSSLPPMRPSQMRLSAPPIPEHSVSGRPRPELEERCLQDIDSLTEVGPAEAASGLVMLTPPEDIPSVARPSASVMSTASDVARPSGADMERQGSIFKMESLSKSDTERSRGFPRQLTPDSAQTVMTTTNTPSSPSAPTMDRHYTNTLSEQDARRYHDHRDLEDDISPTHETHHGHPAEHHHEAQLSQVFHEQHLSHLTKENQLIKKYLVVTHVAVITTILTLVFVMVTDCLGFIVVDMLVHCVCVAFMSKRYDAWYRACCCGGVFVFDLMEECGSCCARDEELDAIMKAKAKSYDASDVKHSGETESLSKSGDDKKWSGT